jgi:arsenate reductase (glutaredoxin)
MGHDLPMKQPQITLYGIPNCDTVKKARAWLTTHGLGHQFHDLKKEGVSAERLATWCSTAGLDKVLNRKGTTWRGLTPTQQESAGQLEHALALMKANTSLIKRPIIEWGSETEAQLTVGFSPETWMKHIQPGA